MHFNRLTLSLAASIALAGCSRAPEPDPIEKDLLLHQATERNLALVVEIARTLRDQRGVVQSPSEKDVFAAVRRQYPASDPKSDVLNDAWGRPLRYEIIHENTGSSLRDGFRVVSAGANGEFEQQGGDDLRHETVITQSASGS